MSDTNVSTFLKKVNNLKADHITAFLPSKGGVIKLKPLNLKQQKDIISSVADGVAGLISFTRILNDIIADSLVANDDTLKIYDRTPIALALRVNSLGSTVKIDKETSIDLNPILEKLKTHKKTLKDEETFTYNDVEVNVRVPSLREENFVIKKLEEAVKRNGEDNSKNLGSIYVYEIIKYIHTVKYDDLTIDYTDLKISDRIDIVEALPLALNKQIISFIEEFRKEERDLLTAENGVVEINPGFFDVE